MNKQICLDLIFYQNLCGAEEFRNYLEERIAMFDIQRYRLDVLITVMGADVQRVADNTDKCMFPCLAHFINLTAKKYINSVDSDPELSDDEHLENLPNDTIQTARYIIRKINDTPSLANNLHNIQQSVCGTVLKTV